MSQKSAQDSREVLSETAHPERYNPSPVKTNVRRNARRNPRMRVGYQK